MLVATLVTLVIVPVLYVIFVEDLHLVKWETEHAAHHGAGADHEPAEGRGAIVGSPNGQPALA